MADLTVSLAGTPVAVYLGDNVSIASARAAAAEASADAAALSAASAEAAAGPTYASTAAGLAATASGEAFAVDNGDGTVTVYLNSAGSAVAQRTLATTAALASPEGLAFLGYIADGAGAVARDALAKMREGRVSVLDYGATGDGGTDDRVAIQAAMDAAAAVGGTVYFPTGDYFVTARGSLNTDEVSINVPQGVNVLMEADAWILLDTESGPLSGGLHVITAFSPEGDNIFQVNVNGRSIGDDERIETGTFVSESVGIRAYGSVPNNIGAANVTIINSRFKNLTYAVQGQGAVRWKVIGNRFERTRLTAVIWMYSDGYNLLYNLTAHNHFENCGDCAVAHLQGDFPTAMNNVSAYNVVANNVATNCNLRTQGGAFDHEPGRDPALQHHISFIGNSVSHTVTSYGLAYDAETSAFVAGDTLTGATSGATATIWSVDDDGATGTLYLLDVTGTFQDNETITGSSGGSALANGAAVREGPWGVGGIVMSGVTNSLCHGNVVVGNFNSNGDFGISMIEPTLVGGGAYRNVISDNVVEAWRGGGIMIDGTTGVLVADNLIEDCGDKGAATANTPIVVAFNHVTTNATIRGNRIHQNAANTNVDATVRAITVRGGGGANTGITIENNDIVSPWGMGIYVNGIVTSRASNINVINNRFMRTDTGSVPGQTHEFYGVDQLLIAGSIQTNCRYGYTVQYCDVVTLRDCEQRGSESFLEAYNFGTGASASTNVRVRNMRAPNGAATAVNGEGTATIWTNDDLVTSSVKGTTANRPTLLASDVGFLYLDTTLDADGKPIWWNGTGWVDATGAAV